MKRLLLSITFMIVAIAVNGQDFYLTGFKTVGASKNVDFDMNSVESGGLGDYTNEEEIIINPNTVDPDSISFTASFNKDARIKMWIDLSSINLPWLEVVDSDSIVESPYVGTSQLLSMLGSIPSGVYHFTFRIGGSADNDFPENESDGSAWQPTPDPNNPAWEMIDIKLTIDPNYNDMSVDHQNFENFTYFPNPVENQLNLKAASSIQNIRIFDMLGKEIKNISPNDIETQIDTQELQPGVYLMKVTINGQQHSYKIIKQ